jgi:hypothetical protein
MKEWMIVNDYNNYFLIIKNEDDKYNISVRKFQVVTVLFIILTKKYNS